MVNLNQPLENLTSMDKTTLIRYLCAYRSAWLRLKINIATLQGKERNMRLHLKNMANKITYLLEHNYTTDFTDMNTRRRVRTIEKAMVDDIESDGRNI